MRGTRIVAETWRRSFFDYFEDAFVVSFTAVTSDAKARMGNKSRAQASAHNLQLLHRLHDDGFFIAPIEAVFVRPDQVTFTVKNETRTLGLEEVLKMREKYDWFR